MSNPMQDLVFNALDNAVENGYREDLNDSVSIALDLIEYCSDFENANLEELLPYIRAWLASPKREDQHNG